MIVALFSDVHGNLPALEVFLSSVEDVAERFICLGDVVDYGPWNDECLERIVALPNVSLLQGNHERLFLGEDDPAKELPLVQQFMLASHARFTRRDLIEGLPLSIELNGRFACVHTIGGVRIYPNTDIEIDRDYIVGHSHHQYLIRRNGKVIVNPGSIGQNRQRIDRVEWALFDTNTESFSFYSEAWDVISFIQELGRSGYPMACIEYYERKLEEALRGCRR
jgi:predicted phosphodiesterase